MKNENMIQVDTSYSVLTSTDVDLPDGKIYTDIDDFYVKWGNLYITFKDGTYFQTELDEINVDIDQKRPSLTVIVPISENGQPDYDNSTEKSW